MDTTDCLGLPFPECEPPLVKDASDIDQFRDLAFAVDAAVQRFADLVDTTITGPPAVIMDGGDNQVGQVVDHFTGTLVFDNAGMADTVADVVRIQRDGWYMFGGGVQATLLAASILTLRVDPLLNGDPVWVRQGDAFNASGTGLAPDAVSWCDVQFLRAGDALTFRTHHQESAAATVAYSFTVWAVMVMPDD